MNKNNLVKCAAVAAFTLSLAATSRVYGNADITLGADDEVYFGLANTNALPAGDAVYMGQFSISDSAIQALTSNGQMTEANYQTLISDFIPLNSVSVNLIGTGTGGDAGSIYATTYAGNNSSFASGPIYVLALNTATTNGATQVGVFRGDSTWTYPGNMNTGLVQIDMDNVNTLPLAGSYAASVNAAALGYAYDADSENDYGTVGAALLEPIVTVPEPSSIALVGMGLLGAIALRRRSKKA